MFMYIFSICIYINIYNTCIAYIFIPIYIHTHTRACITGALAGAITNASMFLVYISNLYLYYIYIYINTRMYKQGTSRSYQRCVYVSGIY